MLHYKVEIKQEAVRLVLEENQTYSAVAAKLEIRKKERELESLRMENALLKKFRTELRGVRFAQRNIGRSITPKRSSR
jgi:transposase-like protein